MDLLSKSPGELIALTKALGLPSFKAKEILRFLHQHLTEDIQAISILTLDQRAQLAKNFYILIPKVIAVREEEGTQKITLQMEEAVVEAVLMTDREGRSTVCVSSQAGCPIGCQFCATGQMGFQRNLTVGEILSQIYYFARKSKISNIVFMGMGEPFLNYENILQAARALNHPLGQNIAARKIIFSTVGMVAGIDKLAAEPEQFRLAWSLISPFDEVRNKLIPFQGLASVAQVLQALQAYQQKTGRRVSIEYVVLKDINDGEKEAAPLIKIARQLDCHINFISYNSARKVQFESGNVDFLYHRLVDAGVNATIRRSFGKEIAAGCGQLITPNA